ncbi:hypothetical protein GSH05_10350 [Burkholderia pseudomallei]|uniref:Uncharacterized protein n=3 Tax=pseudomallei group TaxID=111527 RepID=A0AAX1X7M8_BURML|nr:hypothetical protein BMA2915 [Burkholderia mallei ATCC 23344]ARK49078.1 hypothetical protein BOC35_22960 [Burkholderia pseudomallei]PNX03125.1 hypothetical protein CF649_13690 [Burkholderia sp. 136(2017)]PNX14364.1 hypothetical protein CF650_15920 [Burkholderia sp. 129]PNX29874.1 hypothetical protein CF647_12535 [Burkholderia sp. 117]PNX38679.1 hypothetical protein CF648_13695 [Burkholderia sp. 137]RKO03368.1 hypothetical protein D8O03_10865 [Burkholderia mallei]
MPDFDPDRYTCGTIGLLHARHGAAPRLHQRNGRLEFGSEDLRSRCPFTHARPTQIGRKPD